MARYIFYGILLYMAYRLVFHVILPVRKTAKAMRDQFRQAQEQMDKQREQAGRSYPQSAPDKPAPMGDYIDFEEVK